MQIENFPDRAAALAAVPQLCAVWNAAYDPGWPLTERLLTQCLGDDPLFEPEGLFVARSGGAIIGWVLSKTNAAGGPEIGRFAGRGGIGAWCVEPAHQHQGTGTTLLARAEEFLRAAGCVPSTLYYPFHLTPGVPAECASALSILEERGYTATGRHSDLHCDLTGWQMPEKAVAGIAKNPTVELRPARADEADAVCEFVEREFPGPWTYTIRNHFAFGGAPSDIIIAAEAGAVIGFCITGDFNSKRLIPSTYWYPQLGDHFGGLGPIGIGRDQRKRGLGLAICAAAVQDLKSRGVTAMAIDWTGLIDFYGLLGFTVWKRYVQMDAVE